MLEVLGAIAKFCEENSNHDVLVGYSKLEGDSQNMRMINGRFKTTSGHFLGN